MNFVHRSWSLYVIIIGCLLVHAGCYKVDPSQKKPDPALNYKSHIYSFYVRNHASKTMYLTTFYYAKHPFAPRWRWYKSPVYTSSPGKTSHISLSVLTNPVDVPGVYGYLGVFNSFHEANNAIYELTNDDNKLPLDRLESFQDKTLTLEAERYTFKQKKWDYNTLDQKTKHDAQHELDFVVKNKLGKDIYLTAFIYQRDNPQLWHFEKTDVYFVRDGESVTIDVDTLADKYVKSAIHGYLGIFDKNEKEMADKATFETLFLEEKIELGSLQKLQGSYVVLKPLRYGALSSFDKNTPDIELYPQTGSQTFKERNIKRVAQ